MYPQNGLAWTVVKTPVSDNRLHRVLLTRSSKSFGEVDQNWPVCIGKSYVLYDCIIVRASEKPINDTRMETKIWRLLKENVFDLSEYVMVMTPDLPGPLVRIWR